ncbi:MAG TPA: VOC family protein [Polyangiaceae bacterium]
MANPNTGRFTWHELVTRDPEAATKFYTGLFGYKVQETDGGPAGKYRMLMQGDRPVGGMMQAPPNVPSGWLVYVGVEDVDAAAKKITELGGKVMVPPTEVPKMVRFACGSDPQGAAFGIMKGIGEGGDMPLDDGPPRPGTFCWDELATKDLAAAKTFYAGLFGWGGKGGDKEYWHWSTAGKEIGGMMSLPMPNVPPHWLAYLAVSDVDGTTKKARELGAKVLLEPKEMEKVGKFSVLQDPTGATFALFRSARV